MRTSIESPSAGSAHLRGLLRDFSDALGQQLFFWGRDVIHSDGNLLCTYGLERRRSEGLVGTSCYRMAHEGATIELHGACVGRYSRTGPGFLYIRNRRRCFLFQSPDPPPPGLYVEDDLRGEPVDQLATQSRNFLRWWLEYETWISTVTSSNYRANCYRAFRQLPQSKPWLPPDLALKWLRSYAGSPENLRRARAWKKDRLPTK